MGSHMGPIRLAAGLFFPSHSHPKKNLKQNVLCQDCRPSCPCSFGPTIANVLATCQQRPVGPAILGAVLGVCCPSTCASDLCCVSGHLLCRQVHWCRSCHSWSGWIWCRNW